MNVTYANGKGLFSSGSQEIFFIERQYDGECHVVRLSTLQLTSSVAVSKLLELSELVSSSVKRW